MQTNPTSEEGLAEINIQSFNKLTASYKETLDTVAILLHRRNAELDSFLSLEMAIVEKQKLLMKIGEEINNRSQIQSNP